MKKLQVDKCKKSLFFIIIDL